KWLKEMGAEHTTKDYHEILNDPEIQAVLICSSTDTHSPISLEAIAAGKHVFCEKPIDHDLGRIREVMKALEGSSLKYQVGFNRRFDPSFARVKELMDKGEIGEIEQVTIISRDPAAPPADYIKVSGGIFKDMTIHDFDMARFLLGDIDTVTTIPQNLDPEIAACNDYDAAVIVLTAKSGAVATIINNRHCATGYDQRLEVTGHDGQLNADNQRPTTVSLSKDSYSLSREPYLDFFLTRYADAYAAELNQFISIVKEGGRPTPSIEDGAQALLLAEAAEKSAREQRPVKVGE
ncbi:inositol 2-dehydrogenase, partial [Varibaculum cambriense]|uniref:inositol 2-dehydrogenase n=1 Tax=Varibaculum cambriense TaxID=184870 RepID=UPI00241E8356